MKNCYLENQSPQKLTTRILKHTPDHLTFLTCFQVSSLEIHDSDVAWQGKIVKKFIIHGIIIFCKEGLSPQRKPILNIKVKDSTGICQLQIFQFCKEWDKIPKWLKDKKYVKLCGQTRCQGTYRFEIKNTVKSIIQIEDYNTISLSMMQTMKDSLRKRQM